MATIPPIVDTGAGQDIQIMYNTLNALITAFNELAGGATGQIIRKASNTDFDYEFGTLPNFGTGAEKDSDLNWLTINIGDWNMDSTPVLSVSHGLTTSKIRQVNASIYPDGSSSIYIPIDYVDTGGSFAAASNIVGGSCSIGGSNVVLVRTTGEFFDSSDFDSTGFNRGFITIGYVD